MSERIFNGYTAGDEFGISVSSAGEVNGDGFSDVIIGSYLNDGGGIDTGRASIFFGGNSMNNTCKIYELKVVYHLNLVVRNFLFSILNY